jgi:spore germination protein YaaH
LLILNTSCDKIKKVDKVLKKSFGQLNRVQRKKNNYSKRLGPGNNNKSDSLKTGNNNESNSINQKNMINDYGYLFEMINGVDPGKVVDNSDINGPLKVFAISDTVKSIPKEIEVFGWHPHWMKSKWKNYPFNLLSTIAYFSYKVDPVSGNPQNPLDLIGWTETDFVKTAKQNRTKALLTVSLHGENNLINFLESDISIWENLFSKVSSYIIEKDADGIDINFESLPSSQRSNFLKFIKKFKEYLDIEFYKKNKGYSFLSLSIPSSQNMVNYSIKRLSDMKTKNGSDLVDLFIIMGYDFHSKTIPGPTSPLQSDNNQISLFKTLKRFNSFGVNKSKTILALPYYGLMYNVESTFDSLNNTHDISASLDKKLTYNEINEFFIESSDLNYEIELDPISMSKSLTLFFEDNSMKEIFYDDSYTLSKKFDFAMTQGLKGVGIWALGYDNQRKELWSLIDDSFTSSEKLYVDPIGEVNGFPIRLSKSFIKDKNIYFVIIIFLTFSVIIAALILLSDFRIREKLTSSKINSLILLTIFYIFLIPLIIFINELFYAGGYGIYIKSEVNLYIAMFMGALFFYLGSKITLKKEDKP